MKQSICIISFSPIYRDARVLRQIKYLSPHYDLTVVGYGQPHPAWEKTQNIKWVSVLRSKLPLPMVLALLSLGRFWSSAYDLWYWRKPHHVRALEEAATSKCDAIHANDWEALPVAVEAAKKNDARVVFDAHEYPLQADDDVGRSILLSPAIRYILRKHAPFVDASSTVAPLIAERCKREFSLNPIVVLNASDSVYLPSRELDSHNIRLIHHGIAMRNRRLETMIETAALCDQRYSLHLMLVEHDSGYIQYLKKLAGQLAPGQVTFHAPVAPEEIVRRISEYDVGFYILKPSNYNNEISLPNKFFDFIAAGLAVCIGPSPSMAEIVQQYGLGCVAPTFNPRDMAEMLNRLNVEQWMAMRRAARQATTQLNADHEMGKVIELYRRLL